jgi:hypothetical protein
LRRLFGAGRISPMYEPYRRRLRSVPYIKDGLPLEIKRADPVTGRVIELWRYDYAIKNWVGYSGPSFAI